MRRWLVEIGSIVLALILALVVWANAEQENNPLFLVREVPVATRGLEAGVAVQGLSVNTVDVRGRAPVATWQTGLEADLEVYVDLEELGTGSHAVAVHASSADPGVQVVQVTPATITVRLERMAERAVPVRVDVLDAPPVGYDWHDPVATPDQVQVSGPERYVQSVAVAVAEVYVRNARTAIERRTSVSLRTSDGLPVGGDVEWTPRTVTVTVPIEQRAGYRDVPVRVRWEGQPARGYRISEVAVDPSIVTLVGSANAIEAVPGYVETTPVNIEGASANVVERLALIVPENVSVSGAQSVVVSVAITPIEESTWVQRAPMIQGLDERYQAELSPRLVEILVAGPLPRLEALQPGDVQVVLDLTGLEPGTYNLQPSVILPEGIQRQTLVPETIEVKIGAKATATPTRTPTRTVTATASTPVVVGTPTPFSSYLSVPSPTAGPTTLG